MTTKLRAADLQLVEMLFDMGGGYVLDFTNRTFSDFFRDEIGADIDSPRYALDGASKARRFRCFLRTCSDADRLKALSALWDYRQSHQRRHRLEEKVPNAGDEFHALIARLSGKAPPLQHHAAATLNQELTSCLAKQLLELSASPPQARGYGYERFLKSLFEANGLHPRASFRPLGEQIDGSFEAAGETYLLEAKWQAIPVGAADLRAFNGKVEEKAAWSRGLFVSESGFSEEGLSAFGRGKRVVCMDGLDIYEMLQRRYPNTSPRRSVWGV